MSKRKRKIPTLTLKQICINQDDRKVLFAVDGILHKAKLSKESISEPDIGSKLIRSMMELERIVVPSGVRWTMTLQQTFPRKI